MHGRPPAHCEPPLVGRRRVSRVEAAAGDRCDASVSPRDVTDLQYDVIRASVGMFSCGDMPTAGSRTPASLAAFVSLAESRALFTRRSGPGAAATLVLATAAHVIQQPARRPPRALKELSSRAPRRPAVIARMRRSVRGSRAVRRRADVDCRLVTAETE